MSARDFVILALAAALSACGGADDAAGKTATIDPPNCASSGACQ